MKRVHWLKLSNLSTCIPTKNIHLILLVLILASAGSLRIWGLDFGLPYKYHVDEQAYISAALNLGAGHIGQQPNPTGFSNLLFLEYAAYYLFGKVFGLFPSLSVFELQYRSDPSIFHLLSRFTVVTFGILNVLVMYIMGRMLRDKLTGLISAFLLSVAYLHVRDSHFGVPDIMMASLISLSLFFCIFSLKRSDRKYLLLAAFVAGLATATKWTAFLLIIPIGLTAYFIYPRKIDRQAVIYPAGLLIGGFVLGGFQLFLRPMTYIKYALIEMQAGEAGGFGIWQIDSVPGWLFYVKTLVYGLGPGLLITGVIGSLLLIWRVIRNKDRAYIVLLAFPLSYFLLMGSTRHYFARYALPVIPFLLLFAAEALTALGRWLNLQRRNAGWVMLFILIMISLPTLIDSLRFDYLLTQVDTRTIAKEWIESNVPTGAKIAIDWPVHGPPLEADEIYDIGQDTYEISIIGDTGLSEHPLKWYRQQAFDYLITSSFVYNIPVVFDTKDKYRKEFYSSLDENLVLVKEINPNDGSQTPAFIFDEIYGPAISLWQRDRPGPIIKIYRNETISTK